MLAYKPQYLYSYKYDKPEWSWSYVHQLSDFVPGGRGPHIVGLIHQQNWGDNVLHRTSFWIQPVASVRIFTGGAIALATTTLARWRTRGAVKDMTIFFWPTHVFSDSFWVSYLPHRHIADRDKVKNVFGNPWKSVGFELRSWIFTHMFQKLIQFRYEYSSTMEHINCIYIYIMCIWIQNSHLPS